MFAYSDIASGLFTFQHSCFFFIMYLSFERKTLHMKKFVYLIGACYSMYSCKAPSYSYVPATMNTTAFSHAGEA